LILPVAVSRLPAAAQASATAGRLSALLNKENGFSD
jgi:hypothetical protein